jgi:hypothetical protein
MTDTVVLFLFSPDPSPNMEWGAFHPKLKLIPFLPSGYMDSGYSMINNCCYKVWSFFTVEAQSVVMAPYDKRQGTCGGLLRKVS